MMPYENLYDWIRDWAKNFFGGNANTTNSMQENKTNQSTLSQDNQKTVPKSKSRSVKPKAKSQPKTQQPQQLQKEPAEDLFSVIKQEIDNLNKQIELLNKESDKVYTNMQKVIADYKDKQKDLLGLTLMMMAKTNLNKYIDNDYMEKLGDLIDSLPPEALGEGIKMFNVGYMAGKAAGIDLKDKTITEILALGQEPKLTANFDTGILQTLETLNEHLPKLYELELTPYKLTLEVLGNKYDTLKIQQKAIEDKLKAYIEQIKLNLQMMNILSQIELRKTQMAKNIAQTQKIKKQTQESSTKQQQPSSSIDWSKIFGK